MKVKSNFFAFFTSLLQREVRNLSTKCASGRLQLWLPALLQPRQKYLENTGVRPTGTTSVHRLLPPAQRKRCLREFVPQRDPSPPAKWPAATKVSDFWVNLDILLKKTWFEEFLKSSSDGRTYHVGWAASTEGLLSWVEFLCRCLVDGRTVSPQRCSPGRNVFSKSALSCLFGKRSGVGKTHQTRSGSASVENCLSSPDCPPWSFLPLPLFQYDFQSMAMQEKKVF